jgi:hypothetical protein
MSSPANSTSVSGAIITSLYPEGKLEDTWILQQGSKFLYCGRAPGLKAVTCSGLLLLQRTLISTFMFLEVRLHRNTRSRY